MANVKISRLPAASTPLTGAELVPIVQSGVTSQTTVGDFGAAVSYTPSGTGAVETTVQAKLRETVSVLDFGAVGDGATDDTAAIQAARDYAASASASGNVVEVVFPAGRYNFTTSPNWAINRLHMRADGEVWLVNSSGPALLIDGGATGAGVYGMKIKGDFLLYAIGASSTHGAYIRALSKSDIEINVRGANPAYSGLYMEWGVSNTIRLLAGVNEGGWYPSYVPSKALTLTQRGAGEQCSYNVFINCELSGCPTGAYLDAALGNSFIGGAMQANTNYGAHLTANSLSNKFFGTDFEVNTLADIYCLGDMNEFYGVDTFYLVNFGTTSKRSRLIGGSHESILVDTGAEGCTVRDATYNRRLTGGTFSDLGTGTEISNVRNSTSPYTQFLTGSLAISSASVAYPGTAVETVTVSGAKLGDKFTVSGSVSLASFDVTAQVTAANTVSVHLTNITGASATKPACTLTVSGIRGS